MDVISAAQRHRRPLIIALLLTTSYLVVEVLGGLLTGSLALLADAGHMLTDVSGMLIALGAIWLAGRPATRQRTYGYYRAEILGALLNALLLFFVSGYILYEAWQRFLHPPAVQSGWMILVAALGLAVNVLCAWFLHRAAGESLNMRGAYLEVLSDTLGSLGVIVAGAIMALTGWYYADPLFSAGIGFYILPRTWKLLRETIGILLEGTPAHLNLADLEQQMASVPGVQGVHDLHVWTISSGLDAMSAHVIVARQEESNAILCHLCDLLRERYQLEHATIQIETPEVRLQESKL